MKILVADDDSATRKILESKLTRWGYEVVQAENGVQGYRMLKEPDAPRLVLLDWMMPEMTGVELTQTLRLEQSHSYTYIILMSGKDRRNDLIDGLDSGADDYLVKPINSQELKVRLMVGRRILDWQDQLVEAREKLRFQATHDPLTEILNRGAILKLLDTEFVRSQRKKDPLGVVMIDLDHFKKVNDTLGHSAGDGVLKTAAQRLKGILRPYDALGRYGGEEFVAILPGCDANTTYQVAQRLLEALSEPAMKLPEGELKVTGSLGTASFDLSPGITPDGLLRSADAALYRSKHAGRNQVQAGTREEILENSKLANKSNPAIKLPGRNHVPQMQSV